MESSGREILLDTNFLLDCLKYGIHLSEIERLMDEKFEILVPMNVISELESLNLKGKERERRKVTLKLIENFKKIELEGKVDESILDYALKNRKRCLVCTNDGDLKSELRKSGVPVIFIRGKSHLEKI
ncbi:MAG: PIN domain-containing protein [Candidatus Methanofastidiosia archaeon]